MPTYEVTKRSLAAADVDVIAITATIGTGRPKGKGKRVAPVLGAGAEAIAAASGIDLDAECAHLRFEGKVGSTARIPLGSKAKARELLVVGLGASDDVDAEAVRKAGAAASRASADATSVASTVVIDGLDDEVAIQAFVEGFGLAAYRYSTYKADKDAHRVESLAIHTGDGQTPKPLEAGVATAQVVVRAVSLTRDLVNTPPGDKRPPAFAEHVEELAAGTKVRVKVLDEPALRKGGYGGLLGVGAGSSQGPRLVELTYTGPKATRHIALVGKGITFDSGGLSLKPSESMETMKSDMAGAATVLATVLAAAELKLPVKITGLLALAENMPSGTATRVSDVLTIRGGKTVEVMNTDAEGRLVLADALVHAGEKKPDAIVDIATLTGAVLVALGKRIGGLMANDDGVADELLGASGRSGERLWRLPLPADLYAERLEGDVADLRNSGWGRDGGTIMAGLFLQNFVPDGTPWAHLDIAGLSWTDEVSGYQSKGATGSPVRTMIEWLRAG